MIHATDREIALWQGGLDRAKTRHHTPRAHELGPDTLAAQCKMGKLPEPVREYRFHPTRKWLFDLAWPELKIAVEVDGGTWIYGRHNDPAGWAKDQEKFNEAAILGWRVLHVTPQQVDQWEAFGLVERLVRG